jgi:hypothetical protein
MFPAKLTTMNKLLRFLAAFGAAALVSGQTVFAQSFPAVGTRAAGMGGAFVGVADDASAIYWNPAGLSAGAPFSFVLDGGSTEAVPDRSQLGHENNSFLIGVAMPALGLGYYRLHSSTVQRGITLVPEDVALSSRNLTAADELRLDSLITHHTGITLVQSLWQGVAVGTTLKLVRGIAASTSIQAGTAEEALDAEVSELLGKATNKFDLDLGFMAAGGPLKVGLTVRNVTEPEFEAAGDGRELTLERQARAGLSYAVSEKWIAAADFDLLTTHDAFGERRDIALGVEGRIVPRAMVRTGFSFNTADVSEGGDARRAYSVGGSYAVWGSAYIDGHFTAGNDRAGREWGVSARFVY